MQVATCEGCGDAARRRQNNVREDGRGNWKNRLLKLDQLWNYFQVSLSESKKKNIITGGTLNYVTYLLLYVTDWTKLHS